MTTNYIEEINKLLIEIPVDENYFLKIRDLLENIYEGGYWHDTKIVSDCNRLRALREKKLNEGRSTKSVLSATDCKFYVHHDIWKRLAQNDSNAHVIQRANFLLTHFSKRGEQKNYKTAKRENQTIEILREAIEQKKFTMEVLERHDVLELIDDINPYKNLENYLKNAENLGSKRKSKWRDELPFLLVILGVDIGMLKTLLLEKDVLKDGKPLNLNSDIKKYWLSGILMAIVTIGILIMVFRGNDKSAHAKDEKPLTPQVRNPLDQTITDTDILGRYRQITESTSLQDSVKINEIRISAMDLLVKNDTIYMDEVYVELLIQNTSKESHYVFDEILLNSRQNHSSSGEIISLDNNELDTNAYEISLNCRMNSMKFWPISTPSGRVLAPGQEVTCRLSIAAEERCERQVKSYLIVPFNIGFRMQNVRFRDLKDLVVWTSEEILLGLQ